MSCSITDPLGCLSSAAKSVAGDAFSAIAHDFAKAADSTINWLWGQLTQATSVQLGGPGFDLDLAIVATITGVVAVGLFVIQLTLSVLRRDHGGLARAVKGLFVAFIAGGVAIGITNLALAATDSLSAGVVKMAMGSDMSQMGDKLLSSTAILSVGNPAGMFLLAIVAIAASVIVWAALVVRKALIVVSAIFAPLAFAGSLADITVGWTRKWIEVMAALIISKLVLVLIFIVGWGILNGKAGQDGSGATQSVTQTATGLLILTLAGFAPWMSLKLVHFGEDHFHRLHVLAGSSTAGARASAAVPQKVAAWKATAASFGASSAAKAAGGASGAASGSSRPAAATNPAAGFASTSASRPAGEKGGSGSHNGSGPPRPPGTTNGRAEPPPRRPFNPPHPAS
jgi:type IV secretion system protein TrbL